MARLIEDENLIEYIKSEEFARRVIRSKDSVRDILVEVINEQPTVDAVEVVRCKDCKDYWKNVDAKIGCRYYVACTSNNDNGYCDRGAKLDGGDE